MYNQCTYSGHFERSEAESSPSASLRVKTNFIPSGDEALHFGPLCGSTVEMIKAQIIITIGIKQIVGYVIHFSSEIIDGVVYCREERELWFREQGTERRLYEIGLVPVNCFLQAIFKLHYRFESDQIFGGGNVGK